MRSPEAESRRAAVRRGWIPAFVLTLLTASPGFSFQQGPTASEALDRGDSLMSAHRTATAFHAYAAGLRNHPDDPVLLWKAARAMTTLAMESPGLDGDEERLEEAIALARRAVSAGPDVARAHATLAASLGLYGRLVGTRYRIARAPEVIELAREVRVEARRAIALDPHDFAPYVILGMWHRELATVHPVAKTVARTFLGGYPDVSLETSAAYLEAAVELAPRDVTARLELAKTYREMDRMAEFRREIQAALALPASERLDRLEQEKARRMLAES